MSTGYSGPPLKALLEESVSESLLPRRSPSTSLSEMLLSPLPRTDRALEHTIERRSEKRRCPKPDHLRPPPRDGMPLSLLRQHNAGNLTPSSYRRKLSGPPGHAVLDPALSPGILPRTPNGACSQTSTLVEQPPGVSPRQGTRTATPWSRGSLFTQTPRCLGIA